MGCLQFTDTGGDDDVVLDANIDEIQILSSRAIQERFIEFDRCGGESDALMTSTPATSISIATVTQRLGIM